MSREFLRVYEQFIAPSPDHISIISRDYEYLVVSDSYLKAHGKRREDIVGRKVPDLLGDIAFKKFIKDYLDRCFAGEMVNYRSWFEFREAGRRFMNVTYYPYTEDNAVCGAVVISRDITEYKMTEEKVLESERRYRHLFENLNDALLIADCSTGIIMETNRKGEELFGRSRDELIGMHQSRLHPKGMEDEYRQRFAAHIAQGRGADYEGEIVRKDGAIVPVSISAAPFTTRGRELILGLFRDITGWKKAQHAILESKRFAEALIRSMQDGFSVFDADRRFMDANPAFFRMMGYTRDELEGAMAPMPYWVEEELPRMMEAFREVEGGTLKDYEFTFRRKGGERFQALVSPSVLRDADGRVVSYSATIKDLTCRKLIEREMLKSQKLESLGTLAGGLAHDFNNLLTGILSNISLAALYDDGAKGRARLIEAEKACMRARDLIRQFITFAKGGAPVKDKLRIEGLLRDWAGFAASGSPVRCAVDIDGPLMEVEADEGLLFQAVQSLIINAKESMHGGVVRLSAANADTGASGRRLGSTHVRITVEDSGSGIPAEHMDKIFDPYFSTKEGASGLGLATAHSIVASHGGFIEADSAPGRGSVFSIYLPASVEPSAGPAELWRTGTRRALVMDDEEMIREAAGEILSEMGFSVDYALDGEEAVALYRGASAIGSAYDLVILDLTVPGGKGGAEAVSEIMSIDPGARVMVSSGYSDGPVVADFRRYGFSGVIAKPYRASEMSEAVRRLISG